MTPSRREALLALATAAALSVPAVMASSAVLRGFGLERPFDVDLVPKSDTFALLSPALRLSVADLYWLLTVQYIGEGRREQRGFEKLFPLVDLVTDLDPRHGYAYQTGGIVLSSQQRLEESDRILEKGMEPGRPGWWSYPFYRAFNDYFYRGDYDGAAAWAEKAARTPGASTNISHLAVALQVKRGDPDEAIRFVEAMLAEAKDQSTRTALQEQRRLALLQRDYARLDAALARYRERHGQVPSRLEALVEDGLLERLPPDPYGGRYQLGPDGLPRATGGGHRMKPAEPGRLKQKVPDRTTPTP
jgi:tetratricopeptide (TPR) repeat protein